MDFKVKTHWTFNQKRIAYFYELEFLYPIDLCYDKEK